MNINLEGLAPNSKIWIYQANRALSHDESISTQVALDQFAGNWVAHNRQLKAKAVLVENRFIILAVDESLAGASGCSIDASVHFLKTLQNQLGIDLFDRMRFAFKNENGELQSVTRSEFSSLYASGEISDETIVVDTLIKTKGELSALLKPLKESWHIRMV